MPSSPSKTGSSVKLEKLGRLYLDNARFTKHERRRSKLYWREFVAAVGVKTVGEVTAKKVLRYHNLVDKAGKSSSYVSRRFAKVKTILRFAQEQGVAPRGIDTILSHCGILKRRYQPVLQPHPISRRNLHKLLAVAGEKWTAALLCALNFCMYGAELAFVERADVDLTKGTLVTARKRNRVTRVAVLWPRTTRALREMPQQPGSPLFISQVGMRYQSEDLRRNFVRLRERVGLSESVKFSDIRDGAYVAAVNGKDVPLEQARILGGRMTDVRDRDIKRNPRIVADACAAVEKHYFG